MTESIVTESAAKSAVIPKPTSVGSSKAPDKPDPASKTSTDSTKSASEVVSPSSGVTLPGGRFGNKKQLAIVASALFSLIAGIAGVGLLWPKTDDTNSAQTPTQPISSDTKQSKTSPDNSTGSSNTSTPPVLPTSTKSGTSSTDLPQPVIPTLPNSSQSSTNSTTASQVNFSSTTQTKYKITDQVLLRFQKDSVPQSVLLKLYRLKDNEYTQDQMTREIDRILYPDEVTRYQDYILSWAKVSEPATAQQTPPVLPPSLPIPQVTASSNSSGSTQSYGQQQTPVVPIAPPLLPSTPSNNTVPPLGLPQYPVKSPGEIASQPTNPIIPQVSPATLPPPSLDIHSPVVPPVTPAYPVRDKNDQTGAYGNSNTNYQSPSFPSAPAQTNSYGSGGPVIPIAGQEPPKKPGTQQTPSPDPMLPAVPGVTTTIPAVPGLPTQGGTQTTTTNVPLAAPMVDLLPRPPATSGSPTVSSSTVSPGSLPIPPVTPPPGAQVPGVSVVPQEQALPKLPTGSGSLSGGAGSSGAAVQMVKPPASPPPTVVNERTPTTSYDVDLYEPKNGDSWESISREFYNDTRYAAALKAANFNKPLTSGGTVDVPPLYVLKQKYQSSTRTSTTSSQNSPIPSSAPTWSPPATSTSPATPTGGVKTYRVPEGGTTMRDIAKTYLGNEQRWDVIYNLNPEITSPNAIPAGTIVKLPMDAKVP